MRRPSGAWATACEGARTSALRRAQGVVAGACAAPHRGPRRQRRPAAALDMDLGGAVPDDRAQGTRAVALPRADAPQRARAPHHGATVPAPGRRRGRRPLGGDRARRPGRRGGDEGHLLPLRGGLHGGGAALAQRSPQVARRLAPSPRAPRRRSCAKSPTAVFELPLGQSALTCIESGKLKMWVDALDAAEDRRRQAALVEVLNELGLRCRESLVVIRLRQRPAETAS